MKGWGKRLLLILGTAAIVFGILWLRESGRPKTVTVYFPDKNQLLLVPVSRVVKAQTPDFILEEMKEGPKDTQNLLPAISSRETPITLSTEGRTILVNFRKKPDLDKFPLLLDALLASFKQLPQYATVKFLVAGRPNVVVSDQELGEESLDDFSVNNNLYQKTENATKATIYYILRGTHYLVPVIQWVSSGVPVEQAVATALQNEDGMPWELQPPVPQGSRILSVNAVARGIDLELSFGGNSEEQKLAREAILFTYAQLPSVRTVRFRLVNQRSWSSPERPPLLINPEG